jgi:toxin ParE1/3/4
VARVVWTREALAHVEAIRIYVGQFDPAAAQRLAARLVDAGNRLRVFPSRGRSAGDGFRQLALIRPYLIRYRIEQDTVYIVGVRHSARRG